MVISKEMPRNILPSLQLKNRLLRTACLSKHPVMVELCAFCRGEMSFFAFYIKRILLKQLVVPQSL